MACSQIEIVIRAEGGEQALAELDRASNEISRYAALVGDEDNPAPQFKEDDK